MSEKDVSISGILGYLNLEDYLVLYFLEFPLLSIAQYCYMVLTGALTSPAFVVCYVSTQERPMMSMYDNSQCLM